MNRELINTGYSGTNLLLAFAAGALVGTVAALLLAPGAGQDTRRKMADAARDAAQRPKELVHRASNALHHGRAVADEEVAAALAEAR